jgi:Na+-translocating ferredoxin:NAD+ oxidoreductase RNF subunit RnfB
MAVRTLETARNDAAQRGYVIEVSKTDPKVWTVRCKHCGWAACGGQAVAVINFIDLLERCSCGGN